MRSEDVGRTLVAGLRAHSLAGFAWEAERWRRIWVITRHVHAEQGWRLDPGERGAAFGGVRLSVHDLDVLTATAVAAATGLSVHRAEQEVHLARAFCTRLTATLAAVSVGRLDGARARTLATATADLTEAQAREVEAHVLDGLPTAPLEGTGPVGPWDGAAPRAFTERVNRAVARVRTDTEEEVRRDVRERTGITTWVHPENPALASMTITGPTEQVLALDSALDAGARALTRDELAGRTQGMARVDLLTDAVCGTGSAGGTRVRRELGVVLHADTLLDDGPAAAEPGEVRGAGTPVPVTAATARVLAERATDHGAQTCVLLADAAGHLVRVLRVGATPENGWTRPTLVAAAQRALAAAPVPAHEIDAYRPTVEIDSHVRARDPVCTFPGCGVPSSRCDLDHVVPHPRGPTSVVNTSPRSRRCHRYKSAGLWRARTRTADHGHGHGPVVTAHHWTGPLGTHQVVEVRRLPGC
jgi:hypothetical protein